MTWLIFLSAGAAFLLCSYLTLQPALHMFQLNSYQNLSYRNYLRQHKKEFRSAKRLVPCLIMLLGCLSLSAMPFLFLAGGGLFWLLNRPKKAKKPLVWTGRVKRMFGCGAVLMLLWFLLSDYVFTSLVYNGLYIGDAFMIRVGMLWPGLMLPVMILLQHRLIMLYNDLMAPVEYLIRRRFLNEARDILKSMPDLKVIGITGSYGKTSTKYFLDRLLSTRFNVYKTPGNFNTPLGVTRAVREGLNPTHEIFLCEMGARHVGDIKEVCDLAHPTLGVVTSVGPQHLETFGSLTNVLSTKLELADAVRGKGPVFLNFDSEPLRKKTFSQEHFSYGENGSDYVLKDSHIDRDGSRFTVCAPDGTRQTFTTHLLGYANIQNICGAIAVSHYLGIPLKELVPAVRQLESVPHRLQLIRQPDLSLIDDAYNSNPEGAKNAIDTLALCRGTRIVITPGLVELGDRELEYNRKLGEQAGKCCHYLLTVGNQPRTEAIREGAREGGLHRDSIHACATVQEAMALARSLAGEEKMVLLLNDLTDNY